MNGKIPCIHTERLCLAGITDRDVDDMIALLTNEEIKRTFMLPDFQSHEEEKRMFERFKNLSNASDRFVYGIYKNDRLIGFINEVDVHGAEIEVGYVVHPAEQNQGYATEVLRAAISTLFALGYAVVKAGAFEGNAASMRVMEKCGMHRIAYTEDIEYRGTIHCCRFYEIEASTHTDA